MYNLYLLLLGFVLHLCFDVKSISVSFSTWVFFIFLNNTFNIIFGGSLRSRDGGAMSVPDFLFLYLTFCFYTFCVTSSTWQLDI